MIILRLRVTLEDVEPIALRRIEVPETMRLDRLHLVLQAAMPWQNYHLWEFEAGKTRWGLPDPDYGDDETRPAAKATLADAVEAAGDGAIGYLYDFGDSWQHCITVEDKIEPDPRHLYPRLTDTEGRCPPEDVGGSPGYERFLGILADPNDPEHAEVLEWHEDPFDPSSHPPTSCVSKSSSSRRSGSHAADRQGERTLTLDGLAVDKKRPAKLGDVSTTSIPISAPRTLLEAPWTHFPEGSRLDADQLRNRVLIARLSTY